MPVAESHDLRAVEGKPQKRIPVALRRRVQLAHLRRVVRVDPARPVRRRAAPPRLVGVRAAIAVPPMHCPLRRRPLWKVVQGDPRRHLDAQPLPLLLTAGAARAALDMLPAVEAQPTRHVSSLDAGSRREPRRICEQAPRVTCHWRGCRQCDERPGIGQTSECCSRYREPGTLRSLLACAPPTPGC